MIRLVDPEDVESIPPGSGPLHLHVTDGILGASLEEAAERVSALCRTIATSITLHDVPQPSDGQRNLRRRSDAYRVMAAAARGVAVSSHHEAALVRRFVDPDLDVAVVPLGTRSATATAPALVERVSAGEGDCVVLIAGYVYPGKGHADVIEAAGLFSKRSGVGVDVVAVGGVARGHELLATELASSARRSGVGFSLTGFLTAAAYRERCRGAGLPVVAHRHYSASRSLLDWAELGRRPLVVETVYSREMAVLRPGTLTLVASGPGDDPVAALADAIERAHRDPASTVLPSGHPIGPSLDDAAAAYLAWWETLPW